MRLKLQPPGGERTWLAAVALAAGIISAFTAFRQGSLLFTVLGLLFLGCGAGLWFNQQWARWATIVLMLLLAADCATLLVLKGVTLFRAFYLAAALLGAWQVWKEFSPARTGAAV